MSLQPALVCHSRNDRIVAEQVKRSPFQTLRTVFAPLLILALTASSTFAQVAVPNIFSDHMVLQQKQANRVWGTAAAGEKVTVTIADQSHETAANDAGLWSIMLGELPAGGPHELIIKGQNEIKLSDVLVGEVWICSGQSNMQWSVANSTNADLEKLSADYPRIRMINFPQVGSQEPIWEHKNAKWMVCSPDTVSAFSAVGYYFGRQIHKAIDQPVGLINNAWGGSACEAWIRRDLLEREGKYGAMLKRYDDMAAQYDALAQKPELTDEEKKQLNGLRGNLGGNHRPANIYNGVLKSHMGYGIRGAIWYQGESNAGRAYQYRHLFPLMIQSWREEWQQGDFPFYWVQLADFRDEKPQPAESDWAELREAQTMTTSLPNSGEAVIIDIGEGYDIHPKNKLEVGRRLSRLALADVYGISIASRSPTYKSMEKVGAKIVLTFDHVDGGWRPFDTRNPVGFAIAGEDKKFVWADATIREDGKLEVSSPAVKAPVAVRYAWADNPVCNMFDGAGLPLTPFRTDDWPGVTVNNE